MNEKRRTWNEKEDGGCGTLARWLHGSLAGWRLAQTAGPAGVAETGSAAEADEPEEATDKTEEARRVATAEGGAVGELLGGVVPMAGEAEQDHDDGNQPENQAKSEEEQSGVDQHESVKILRIIFRNRFMQIRHIENW